MTRMINPKRIIGAINGKSQTIALWAKEYKIKYATLYNRIMRGWDIEKALITPVVKKNKMKKRISPIKYFGGGFYKVPKIVSVIDWDEVYCEPFLGGGNVLLNSPDHTKEGKKIKKYAFDRNWLLINCWKHIQTDAIRLQNFLKNVDHSKENFDFACNYINTHEDCVEEESQYFMLAAMYLVRNRFSRAANEKNFGYSPRLRRGMPEYISSWLTMIESLPFTSEKIKDVVFACGDAVQLMIEYSLGENPYCVTYADPPFCHESRVTKNSYKYEMKTYCKDAIDDETTHECLLDYFLQGTCGPVYLSGYNNQLYDKKLVLCEKYEWKMKNSASQKSKKPIMNEVLWKIG